jgi:cytochrome P450 family 135
MARVQLPPGPALPRSLQTLAWLTRPGPFMWRAFQRYGDTFTLRLASYPRLVFVTRPEHVREVFTGDPDRLHAGEANRILLPLVGPHSILLLDDSAHVRQRKLLLPPFHGERMRAYGGLIRDVAEREVATWSAGARLRLAPRMQAITLEVIMRAVFGMRQDAHAERVRSVLSRQIEAATRPAVLALLLSLGPERVHRHRLLRRITEPVRRLLLEEVSAARVASDLERREDILALLVQARDEDGAPMSDDELVDELVTLLVAGHETTATALAWAIERLVRHPDAYERLREGGEDYALAVAQETLRLRPVFAFVDRRLVEPARIAGWDLPAGIGVSPCIWLLHRREDIYPEPHAFRPERFLETPPGTYTWIPFGGGIRRCLGAAFALLEMTVVLSAIAQGPRLTPGDRDAPEPVSRRAVTLVPGRRAEVTVA